MSSLTSRRRLAVGGAALAVPALVAVMAFSSNAGAGLVGGDGDLAVEKSDSPDPVQEGARLTYTITVQNLGSTAVDDVVLEDRLPNRVDFRSAELEGGPDGACDRQGRTVTCEIGTIAAGETATVTIRVRPEKDGTITNEASVESESVVDPNPANNEDTEATQVIGGPSCAGRPATIVGTTGDDVIVGTEQRDVISALSGNDEVNSLGGKDRVCGKGGRDKLKGKADDDLVKGGNGRDVAKGGGGDDVVRGGPKRDRLRGGSGDDLLAGGGGNDNCRGGPGADTLKSC